MPQVFSKLKYGQILPSDGMQKESLFDSHVGNISFRVTQEYVLPTQKEE